jgi:hypothetical protein
MGMNKFYKSLTVSLTLEEWDLFLAAAEHGLDHGSFSREEIKDIGRILGIIGARIVKEKENKKQGRKK